ncbi:hypothetical protein [Paenibacillus rhizoplanae]|uniref:Uncharacterized protein n=1 Tax=Paenibacillus rhizoplanae TaxID=1917181 RepID=A0ABW5F9E6_9BACL
MIGNPLQQQGFASGLKAGRCCFPFVVTAPGHLKEIAHLLHAELGAMIFNKPKSQFFGMLKMCTAFLGLPSPLSGLRALAPSVDFPALCICLE